MALRTAWVMTWWTHSARVIPARWAARVMAWSSSRDRRTRSRGVPRLGQGGSPAAADGGDGFLGVGVVDHAAMAVAQGMADVVVVG